MIKQPPIRSKKLRDSARGQDCTVNAPMICNHNPETTILAHLPDESHGMARKSDDISACFSCSACHDYLDSRTTADYLSDTDKEWLMRRAMIRTWRKWIEIGLIKLEGMK